MVREEQVRAVLVKFYTDFSEEVFQELGDTKEVVEVMAIFKRHFKAASYTVKR